MEENDLFFIEGEKYIREIPADWEIVSIVYSESYYNENNNTKNNLIYKNKTEIIKDSLFSRISYTKTPQGIMAVCRKKIYNEEDILNKKNALIVFVEEMNDPGNLGTIIRTIHACSGD